MVEFICGTFAVEFMNQVFPGGFVGVNLYSRSDGTNLREMEDTIKELGLEWAMDDWGRGYHHVSHKMDCEYNFPDDM